MASVDIVFVEHIISSKNMQLHYLECFFLFQDNLSSWDRALKVYRNLVRSSSKYLYILFQVNDPIRLLIDGLKNSREGCRFMMIVSRDIFKFKEQRVSDSIYDNNNNNKNTGLRRFLRRSEKLLDYSLNVIIDLDKNSSKCLTILTTAFNYSASDKLQLAEIMKIELFSEDPKVKGSEPLISVFHICVQVIARETV